MATPFWNLLKFDESLLSPLQLAATINCNLSTGETALYIAVTEYCRKSVKANGVKLAYIMLAKKEILPN